MPYPKRKKPPKPKWKLRRGQPVVLRENRTDRLLGNATYVGKATVYCWLDPDGRLCTANPPEQEPCEDDSVAIDVNVFPVPTPKFRMWEPPGVCDRIAAGQRVPVRIYYGTQVRWEPKPKPAHVGPNPTLAPGTPDKHVVVCQKWEESERGWGCRPDGYTLHLSEGDRKAYVDGFMQKQYQDNGPTAPAEYTRPYGTPYLVDVDDATYRELLTASGKSGIRRSGTHPTGQPGPDGWRSTGATERGGKP